jgi:hypothetical protein
MVRRWHTPEQIIGKLRGADRLLAGGRMSPRLPGTWRCPSRPITGGGTSSAA